jgi:WD40 repeat protein
MRTDLLPMVWLLSILAALSASCRVALAQGKPPQPTQEGGEVQSSQRESEVWSVSVTPDGRKLALARGSSNAGAGAALQLWDLADGTKKVIFEGGKTINALAISPNGQRVASASFDNILRIFDIATGRLLHELPGHKGGVTSVAWSSDGKRIVSGGLDRSMRLWDAVQGKALEPVFNQPQQVYGVAFLSDKDETVSTCQDGTVTVWDLTKGDARLKLPGPRGAQSVAVSPDGKKIAVGYWDRIIRLWDSGDGKPLAMLRGHTFGVYGLAFSPDGKTLASTSGNYPRPYQQGEMIIWDVDAAKRKVTKQGHAGAIWACCFSPDGKSVFTCGADQTVRVWDPETGEQRSLWDVPIALAAPLADNTPIASDSDHRIWWLLGGGLIVLVILGVALGQRLRHRAKA